MRKIKLLSYFLLSVLSAHVAAGEGSGFKIISEKTEMTPGIKGWIVKNNNYPTHKNATQAMSLAYDAKRLAKN